MKLGVCFRGLLLLNIYAHHWLANKKTLKIDVNISGVSDGESRSLPRADRKRKQGQTLLVERLKHRAAANKTREEEDRKGYKRHSQTSEFKR